jgi:hypothetical protein
VTTVRNENTGTLLLDHPRKHEGLNTAFTVESTSITRAHIDSAISVAPSKKYIHNVYKLPSIEATIRYLHAAAGFPTKESWFRAIWRGKYNSWPLINVKNVFQHFPKSEETQKGHMRGQRQGVHSTKTKRWGANVTSVPIEPSPKITPHIRKGDIMIFDYNLKSTMYTNQTGLFPRILSLGNMYVMILHNVDSNLSWMEALKDNTSGKLILAQARALECMQKAGIVPKHQILDNQKLVAYKEAICALSMTFELVSPDNHHRNMAEKAIQTFKDHFIGVLSGCAPTFPLHLGCQLLPQVERQLLLLCQSQLHANLSAYAHVYGHHDYNRHPFIPIGMEALVHDKPHKRRTYAEHCMKAFVLGTSPDHYQCWKFWSTTMRAT